MKHKKLFLTIAAVLHFYVYSMEKSITIPEGYFKAGPGYLPNKHKSDFYNLRNIYYDYVIGKYKVETHLKETSDFISNLEPLNETRSAYFRAWDAVETITGRAQRRVKITPEEMNQIETHLNHVAFFLEPK